MQQAHLENLFFPIKKKINTINTNNFKNLKALLKNILHVKGSEVILDFKGTF